MIKGRALARRLRSVRDDEQAVSAVEMGLIFFPLMMFMVGTFDMGHLYYGQAVLNGAVAEAGRLSSLEAYNSDQTALNNMIKDRVKAVNPSATLQFDRKSYNNFSDIGTPEKFTDGNSNAVCDNGEPFDDKNGNGTWDANGGAGQGGASDVVVLTVTMTFPRFFPLTAFIGGNKNATMVAKTTLRNQPFASQRKPSQGACS